MSRNNVPQQTKKAPGKGATGIAQLTVQGDDHSNLELDEPLYGISCRVLDLVELGKGATGVAQLTVEDGDHALWLSGNLQIWFPRPIWVALLHQPCH